MLNLYGKILHLIFVVKKNNNDHRSTISSLDLKEQGEGVNDNNHSHYA